MIHLRSERQVSWVAAAVSDRGQEGVRHREHISPLGVLVVGESALLH